MKRVVLSLVASLIFVSSAAAQSTANATIRGRVVDESGAAMPGVTVTATSPALLVREVVVVTDREGIYSIPDLPIGRYTVVYELTGFSRLTRQEIVLSAGFTAEINTTLKIGSLEENVTVVGASPVVDTTASTPSVNLSSEVLTEVLPVTRRVQDVLQTTPGISTRFSADLGGGTSGGGAYSNYGISGQTTVLMDGVNTRQDAVIDQGTGNGPDLGSLEEMQVVSIAGGAEQALPGVFMNMIVKSGGNSFHGRYEVQGVTDALQSNNITPELQAQGISVGDAFKQSSEVSGDLGGRIIKDRLWFYVAGRYRSTDRTALGFVKETGPDGLWATSDDVPALRTGYDNNRTVKGTLQLTQNYKLIGFYASHVEHFDPYPGQVTRLNPHHTTLIFDWDPNQIKAELQGTPRSGVLFNFLVGRQEYTAGYSGQPDAPAGPRNSDNVSGLVLGFNHAQDKRPRQSWGPSGSASYFPSGSFLGRHEFKTGFTLMLQDYSTGRPDSPNGNYDLIFSGGNPLQMRTYNYPLVPKNKLNEGGMFFQDTWRLDERTTLNVGLRWDYFHAWVPEQTKPQGQFGSSGTYPEVDAITWRSWAPRFGVAYDLTGNGKTVVKASFGRYNHSPGDSFAEAYNRNSITTTTYRWSDPNGNRDYDPGEVNLATVGNPQFVSISAAANNILPVNLSDPRTYQATIAVDRELRENLAARVSYIYVRQADPYQAINILRPIDLYTVQIPRQDPGPDGILSTADDGGMVTVYDYPSTYVGSNFVGNQRVTAPDDRDSRLYTLEGVITKRYSQRWGMLASVAVSKNNRYLETIATTPNQNYFPKDTTWDWQAKITGNYELPLKIDASGSYTIYNGIKGARTYIFTGIPSASTVTLRLEEYGKTSGPSRDMLNVRFARDFRFSRDMRIRPSVEVLNVFNSADPWTMTFASGPNFGNWGTIDSPRIVRGSVSFSF